MGVLEVTYMTGLSPDLKWFFGLSDEEAVDVAVETVAKATGMDDDKLQDMLIDAVVKRWDSDPHTLGAFTEAKRGQVN